VDEVSATAGCDTCVAARAVAASVRVEDSELFTRSTLLGRVFEDKNPDGQQATNEPGISGARVVMDDGTWVTTDARGMFHVPDLEPGPHGVKLDLAPVGGAAIPTTDVSTVVTIAPGLLASVRFGVAFPRDTVSVVRVPTAISSDAPLRVLDLAGNTEQPSLTVNGVNVPVVVGNTMAFETAGDSPRPASASASWRSPWTGGKFATSIWTPVATRSRSPYRQPRHRLCGTRPPASRLPLVGTTGRVDDRGRRASIRPRTHRREPPIACSRHHRRGLG
jgi:hypothetical protein